MKARLSLLIPLILVLVSLTSDVLVYFYQYGNAKKIIEHTVRREVERDMARLQNILYSRLSEGLEDDAQLELSLVAMTPGIRTLLMTDPGHKVMLSNNYGWKGDQAAGHSHYADADALGATRAGQSAMAINSQEDGILQGYFPLIVSYRHGGLEKKMGVLYVEADISQPLREERAEVLNQSLVFAAVTLGAALLIAFILHRLVSRRVKVLVAAARRLESGDYSAKTWLRGNDELAELGRAFDRMSASVCENIGLREQAANTQRRVLQTTIDGYWHISSEGLLVDVNDAYCRMSGYSRAELLRMGVAELEAKEQAAEEVRAHLERVVEKGWDLFETLHRHRDGHLYPVEIIATYWQDTREFFAFIRDIADRKRNENALVASKQQYDRLVTNIPIGVYLLHTTAQGQFTFRYVSPRFARMLGTTAEAIYADPGVAFAAIHPGDLQAFVQLNQQAVTTLQPFLWEGRVLVDGMTRWLRIESKPDPVGNGECIWDGVMSDVTERRQAQFDLQLEQERLSEAQKVGRFGSWELDLLTGKLIWSDEIFHLFEIDKDRFPASYEAFLQAVHPDDRAGVDSAYNDSLKNRLPYQITHRLLMADGRVKWVEERCSSKFDASGKPLRSLGTVQDVTERELLSEQLRIAAVSFDTQEAIIVTDADANIIRANHAFEVITGYTQQEVLGRNPRMLASGRHDSAFYAAMWHDINHLGRWSGEVWDRRKNGEVYPKWLTITAVKHKKAVTHYVAVFVDITERKRAEEEIRTLAFYDALTLLPNRRLLTDRLHHALAASARSQSYGAVLFLDMDRFKVLNDTLGHDHGDELLLEVAKRLLVCVRDADTVARLGGDEFVVLLGDIGAEQEDATQKAATIAEKIRVALSVPYEIKGKRYHTSPSIGVSLYRGTGDSVETVLKQADMAMYQAKEAGRNTVRNYDPGMQQLVDMHAALENDLRHAISNGELELYYQIQVDNEMRPLGAEALIRWLHPQRGMVSPAQFIPVAEETTLILDIGRWVLETACRQLAQWKAHEHTRHLILAVNISAQQFLRHDLVDQVASLTRLHGLDPSRLKLELTESVVLTDVADVVAKMHALKALGVRLSLDDFGTGYSSLSYLKQLPLDQIKIDQSFVRDIVSDPNDAVMVQTIIDLGKNFRLNVIAEGVETEAQLGFLKQNGCMAYQGYLFSKPVPLPAFEKLLAQSLSA